MPVKTEEFCATGRRKAAVARVRMRRGTGKVTINDRDSRDYLCSDSLCGYVVQPMMVTGTTQDYDVFVNLTGGGTVGQAGALRHGIARALLKVNPDYRSVLKESSMLTRDARVKERKKMGQPGARKRFQFSKR